MWGWVFDNLYAESWEEIGMRYALYSPQKINVINALIELRFVGGVTKEKTEGYEFNVINEWGGESWRISGNG